MRTTPAENPRPAPEHEQKHILEFWYVILRHRNVAAAVFLIIVVPALIRSLMARPVYQARAQILIERETPQVLSFREVSEINAVRDDYYLTQYRLLQSRALARRVVQSLKLLDHPEFGGPRAAREIEAASSADPGTSPLMEKTIDRVLIQLKVEWVRNSRLVHVSFESSRPELAAEVANRLSQLYIEQSLEFRYQTSSEAARWLEGQMEEQKKKVAASEIGLQQLKEKEGIVNLEERRSLLEQKLRELNVELTKLKTTRLEREALYRQMKAAPNPEELPDVMRSLLIHTLRVQQADLERKLAQLLERYLDQHPEVVGTRNELRETRSRISAEAQRVVRAAENDHKAAVSQEASVAMALEAAKAEALDLSRRSLQYDTAKREVDASKEVLTSLMSRLKQTDVSQDLKTSNIRIVDRASLPRAPIRPKRLADMTFWATIGIACGIGLALFLEYLNNTVRTPDDVRQHVGAPLLTVVPDAEVNGSDRTSLLVSASPFTPFAEGYRLLRTALVFCWPEQTHRIVLVCSTLPGEGKTVTSVNLALTLASAGGKVLLVDADLRKPNCHTTLRAKRLPGLSDVLVGTAKPSDAIQHHALASASLSLLPAGNPVPSPSDILASHSLRGLLEGLRGVYDWVIIDTPPVGAVSDALVIAPLTDGVAIVAGAERVPRKAVKLTLARLLETGARVLGIVLNRAQVRRDSYYYTHYYGHYYGDAYVQEAARAGSPALAGKARGLTAADPRPAARRGSA